jgi:hypothetical protein
VIRSARESRRRSRNADSDHVPVFSDHRAPVSAAAVSADQVLEPDRLRLSDHDRRDHDAAAGYVSAFYGMFQHWNVKTPQWLGYVIQRPESHGLHHELGIHGRNYSDFPLWDMLMGTFVNPETFDGEVGFAGDAPDRRAAMLLFRDVNAREDVVNA